MAHFRRPHAVRSAPKHVPSSPLAQNPPNRHRRGRWHHTTGGDKNSIPSRRHRARPPYSPAEPKTDLARSTPKKHAAFAGNARSMAGATPRYRAAAPSSLKRVLKGRADKQGIAGERDQKKVSMLLDKGGWSPRARQI